MPSTTIRRSPSVIGETGAAGAERVVMAGGHLDSVPAGARASTTTAAASPPCSRSGGSSAGDGFPAGTALRFAFWGAEEVGLVGSRRYVEGLSRTQRRSHLGVPQPRHGRLAGRRARGLRRRRARSRRPCVATSGADAPRRDLGDSSDHAPFAAAGIPVGGIFTGLDDCYHRRCDTIDNVDRAVLTTSARAAGAALVDLTRRRLTAVDAAVVLAVQVAHGSEHDRAQSAPQGRTVTVAVRV